MVGCPECARLREECALAFAEYQGCKDELTQTRKKDKAFGARRRALEQAEGKLRECRAKEAHHRDEEHASNRLPCEEELAPKIARLRENVQLRDEDGVQKAIFDLSPVANGWKAVPDEVAEQLLTLLRDHRTQESGVAAHLLNYFEFESPRLARRQKTLCIGFLQAHGNEFTDIHSRQVVAELREGDYLK